MDSNRFSSAISVLLDMKKTAYSAVAQDTVTPAEPVDPLASLAYFGEFDVHYIGSP